MSKITQTWVPDLTYRTGRFLEEIAVSCDESGKIVQARAPEGAELRTPDDSETARLKGRALLPGLVNTHSHAFQRVLRGRTEYRTHNSSDSFWTWREMMYSAATRLTPDDIYDASRMAFLEMALGGVTAVGEFHYLHHAADGSRFDDPNLLAKQVVRAAHDVGLRITLLRVAYVRSGYRTEANPLQARFIEKDPENYLRNVSSLKSELDYLNGWARTGIAPHSVRAVPLSYLKEIIRFGNDEKLPIHMHLAEQPAEVSACIEEYGRSPVALLHSEGLLSERFTGIHVIHITSKAVRMLAEAGAMVCACPTTERNLGDGVVPVDAFFQHRIPVSLGSDSQTQIDLLEDARELEYHLRLQRMQRVVLAEPDDESRSGLAARLFDCATTNGAKSIEFNSGSFEPGSAADFFTINLCDASVAGASKDDLLSAIVFSLSRTAIRDVVVGGKHIVKDGRHSDQEEIVNRFRQLQRRLWG